VYMLAYDQNHVAVLVCGRFGRHSIGRVADCYMGHVLKNVMSCTKCEVTNCFVTWAIANSYTFYTHVREMYIIYGGIIFSLSSDVT